MAITADLAPSEFWRMHPKEFWWFIEAKYPSLFSDQDDLAELYEMISDGYN